MHWPPFPARTTSCVNGEWFACSCAVMQSRSACVLLLTCYTCILFRGTTPISKWHQPETSDFLKISVVNTERVHVLYTVYKNTGNLLG